ncbi:hypothetical protein AXA84_0079 [Candidatus Phytoplasma oryzae]|uniref:Uncharacterized protein n=1 Tax=Candidatus Phytoplasma oryzae TaxID=203274 RepID=A0A139JRG7_9MOLU|nr:hypothetical protein [Candidatus Phytoplasma oryzae]KXT29434.1 hypothetical protein AXA84_0079 [Candidatus Phytoplasma oryzae]RAM58015.1 hypothetical protein DH96_00450 [Candidatus Phytoplasma oryzae]
MSNPKLVYAKPFFYQQSCLPIKIANIKNLQEEWLKTQLKIKKYDFNVSNIKDIQDIMKFLNINLDYIENDIPSYNSFNNLSIKNYLKDPPEGLLGIYLKPRINPFKSEYPSQNYKFTIEDFLEYRLSIQEIYCFWDINKKKNNNEKVEIFHIKDFINFNENIEDYINNYLLKNNIIQQSKLVQIGCFNKSPDTEIIFNLPQGKYNGYNISAIYFDNGIRSIDSSDKNVNDLLKMSNGAEKIYIFSIENSHKIIKNINLGLQPNPLEAILNWKKENNFFDLQGEYKEKKDFNNNIEFILNTFSQKDTIYLVKAFKDYSLEIKEYYQKLKKWQDQCYFKPNDILTLEQIIEKIFLFLRTRFIYSSTNYDGIYHLSSQQYFLPNQILSGIYSFKIQLEEQCFSKKNCDKIIIIGQNINDKISKKDIFIFNEYYDILAPPLKPQILS